MTPVYTSSDVAQVQSLHACYQAPDYAAWPVLRQLQTQAETLVHAHRAGDARVRFQIMCWWPKAAGQSVEAVMAAQFGDDDARVTVAREHGFADWNAVVAVPGLAPDPEFETALTSMLAGDLAGLKARITDRPDLVHQRSVYGHGATLLHYLAANGVESHRQVVPLNAPDIAAMLIAAGADPSSEAHMYGGGQTPHALATTSAHPYAAGLGDRLAQILADR